ncbi:MAG: cytochrome c oxidase accessory protein FixG [Flavobacteriales bacterium]|jgi:cytochrome c oxidase accessory protein FixG
MSDERSKQESSSPVYSNPESPSSESSNPEIRYRNLYEKEEKIYTRKITGFFQNVRRYTGLPLIAAYLLLPWIVIDGRPAVWFDLPTRQFHIGWMTFWPQDFALLGWLLIIAAFVLFTVTALFGRVWCGFTCPQTVWTLMYISVEHFFEGDRNKQMKLDQQAWSLEKAARKTAKHGVWLLIAFITGVTFIGYFMPIRDLLLGLVPYQHELTGMLQVSAPTPAIFWTGFFTVMTYMNAGWLREQVCKYMCPYARFQSAMYDKDTFAVHYDEGRGENRGSRKPKDDYKSQGLGDCIDCSWCVQVCPVDIDIRDGLQYECINCGLCVDACNAVMDKMKYERGLIRFTSLDAIETGHTKILRPRVFAYMAGIFIMLSAFSYVIFDREPLNVDMIRDRGARLYRLKADEIQNIYMLKISNMDNQAHSYAVELSGGYDFKLKSYRPVLVEAGEVFTSPLRIAVKKSEFTIEKTLIHLSIYAIDKPEINAEADSSFIGPGSH